MVQSSGGFSRTAAAAAASGHQTARAAGGAAGHLPGEPRQTGNVPRPLGADSRRGPRNLRVVAAHAAAARGAVGEGAADAGAHLLQIRRRQPRRQPQAQHRRRPGLLQQGRRHQTARHRDRRGPVGFVAGVGVQTVRAGVQRLHGQGQLRPEALPPDAHAYLGRDGASQPERPDRIRAQAAGARTRIVRAASASPSARPSRTPSRIRTRSIRSAACSTTSACTRPSSARNPSSRWKWPARNRT